VLIGERVVDVCNGTWHLGEGTWHLGEGTWHLGEGEAQDRLQVGRHGQRLRVLRRTGRDVNGRRAT
jgi:hypothetical protein